MKDKAKSRILEGNIPFVENCHDVTNCDLLGHCISLGQDKGETLSLGCIPCREDQDGQGGLIYQGHEGERKWGRSSNHFQCIKDTKLARIKVLKLN